MTQLRHSYIGDCRSPHIPSRRGKGVPARECRTGTWLVSPAAVVMPEFGSEPRFEPEPVELNTKFGPRFQYIWELEVLGRIPSIDSDSSFRKRNMTTPTQRVHQIAPAVESMSLHRRCKVHWVPFLSYLTGSSDPHTAPPTQRI